MPGTAEDDPAQKKKKKCSSRSCRAHRVTRAPFPAAPFQAFGEQGRQQVHSMDMQASLVHQISEVPHPCSLQVQQVRRLVGTRTLKTICMIWNPMYRYHKASLNFTRQPTLALLHCQSLKSVPRQACHQKPCCWSAKKSQFPAGIASGCPSQSVAGILSPCVPEQ